VAQAVQAVVEQVLQAEVLLRELQVQQILAVVAVAFMVGVMHQEQVAQVLLSLDMRYNVI
jgi:hypothetical protein